MHPFEIKIQINDTGEEVVLQGNFLDEDWIRMHQFVEYSEDLASTTFVQNGMSNSLNIQWDRATGLSFDTNLPPWEEVIVFLHRFRPIGLQSEATSFYKMCNVLSEALSHPYFRALVKEQREMYSGKKLREMIAISINDIVINSEEVLYDWLNSYEYHRNQSKKEAIDDLLVMMPMDALRSVFVILLTEKFLAIMGLTSLIRVVLGKQRTVSGKIPRPDK